MNELTNILNAVVVDQSFAQLERKNKIEVFLQVCKKIDQALSISYQSKKPELSKRIIYELTLFYNRTMHFFKLKKCLGWWHEVSPRLFLGGLPLRVHFAEIKKLGLAGVVSVVESFEVRAENLQHPISKEDWETIKVKRTLVETEDFGPVSMVGLARAVEAIRECLQDANAGAYVHCKAGKSRSASAVVSYLCTHGGMSLSKALTQVRSKRPNVCLKNKGLTTSLYIGLFCWIVGESQHAREGLKILADLERLDINLDIYAYSRKLDK